LAIVLALGLIGYAASWAAWERVSDPVDAKLAEIEKKMKPAAQVTRPPAIQVTPPTTQAPNQ
jgi:hypothetical protein